MGKTYALQELNHGDCIALEAKEKTREDYQYKAETGKRSSPEWFNLMPRELADQAITRNIIFHYMLL